MSLRPFYEKDFIIMETWLNKDHVKQFYGDSKEWMDEISENLNIQDNWACYFIVEFDRKPIGFAQYYDTHKAPEGNWSAAPLETAGIDYMIGEEEFLGKGLGTKVVRAIVDQVCLLNQYSHIIADPISENVASIAVLTKNGFRILSDEFYILDIKKYIM